MLYTILIFRDFIFKENALFTYFIVFFLYETVKITESILNSDDIVYPFLIFRLFVFVPHFVDVYVYAGTINRPLRLLTVFQNVANGLLIMQRPPTKHVANNPLGVGADSSRPYPDITKYTYPFQQIRIFTLSNVRFRSPFRGCIRICGHDESDPYGCLRSAKMLLMGWNFVVVYVSANTIKLCTNVHLQLAITQQHTQNAYFRIAKTILLQCKNPLFARQKPYFCTAKRGFLYNGIMCKRM